MSKPLLNNSSSVSTMTAVHFDDLPSDEGKIDMCIRYESLSLMSRKRQGACYVVQLLFGHTEY